MLGFFNKNQASNDSFTKKAWKGFSLNHTNQMGRPLKKNVCNPAGEILLAADDEAQSQLWQLWV